MKTKEDQLKEDEHYKNRKINKDYKLKMTIKDMLKIEKEEKIKDMLAEKLNKNVTKDDIENIRPVLSEDTDKMVVDFQKFFDLQEQIELKKYREAGGNVFVKVHFESKDTGECMWCQIKTINIEQKFMYGRLCNSPIFIKNLKMGDWVTVKFQDILAFNKGDQQQ